jgi:lysozyme
MMHTSKAGIDLIKQFESFSPKPYLCPANVWTIGYGHTRGVTENTKQITEPEACDLLKEDLFVFESQVNGVVDVPLKQHQFDALVSFVFNVGAGAFSTSTMLKMINAGNMAGAANQFLRWTKAGGRVLNGLVKRRAAERAMFVGDA